MATHTQRKRFDHPDLAFEAAEGFKMAEFQIPGINVTSKAVEIDGQFWAYVTHEGEFLAEPMLLPGYEKVG